MPSYIIDRRVVSPRSRPWGFPDAKNLVNPPDPYTESFETGFGSWANDSGNASDWLRNSGGTSSSGTGPSGAYSGSYYIYIETSSGSSYSAGDTAILSLVLGGELYDGQVDFYYHQYGNDQGTLYLEGYNGSAWETLWSSTGNQGTAWINQVVEFTGKTALRFRNVAAGGYEGDVALDMIAVS